MAENQKNLTLKDRRIIEIRGEDATHFLHNLITTHVENINPHEMYPGALLSPQGKLIFNFLIGKIIDGFLIDIDAPSAEAFQKRLFLYKLRSKVEIHESLESVVSVSWQNDSDCSQFDSYFIDKRFPANEKVVRHYIKNKPSATTDSLLSQACEYAEWTKLRMRYAIGENGFDFELGDVFAHDINFDQIGGLSFIKGCYIGQEVVSRMHHRGTARRRLLLVESEMPLPIASTLKVNGKLIGQLGTVIDKTALALVRIDRVKMAMDNGEPIMAGTIPVKLSITENMNFTFPEKTTEND